MSNKLGVFKLEILPFVGRSDSYIVVVRMAINNIVHSYTRTFPRDVFLSDFDIIWEDCKTSIEKYFLPKEKT